MTEMTQNEELSFEQMLDESLKTLNTGDKVKGVVISITPNEVHLDLGAKQTGVLAQDQVSDDSSLDLNEAFKVGDEVEVFIISVSDIDGISKVSKKRIDSINNWSTIVNAHTDGTILPAKIIEAVKGGVIAIVDSVKVFIPASQTSAAKDAPLESLIGTTTKVKIIDINEERRRAVASSRLVARELRRENEENVWNSIEVGNKYNGTVKSLTDYGAFVDIGGVDGMVHRTELSWKHIKHPSEVLKVGDKIDVFVKGLDFDKRRIALGYKTEDNHPWNVFIQKYAVGDDVDAKIVNMMPFGAFAEIIPGVDGLIHISQIDTKKIAKPSDVLEIGQAVKVKITEIDNEKKKINLSMKALMEPESFFDEVAAAADEE